nr:nucleotidyltransferase family protein [Maliibacterium massiliense]
MRIIGIICEYNPLHNGHVTHFTQAKARVRADYVICVMSTCFTQRGEVAAVDPFTRARWALEMGADLVLALPTHFSLAPAPLFAQGGVQALHATGLVTHLAFGSESGDVGLLWSIARCLEHETPAFRRALMDALSRGCGYPAARLEALRHLLPDQVDMDRALAAFASPNDMLAIEYLRANVRYRAGLTPVAVRRTHMHNDARTSEEFASATALRTALFEGAQGDWHRHVPAYVARDLDALVAAGDAPVDNTFFETFMMGQLRRMRVDEFTALPDMETGLDYAFVQAARSESNLYDTLMAVKSKRYTFTRLQRMAWYAALGVTDKARRQVAARGPAYLRVLGARKDAKELLSLLAHNARLPVIVRSRDVPMQMDPVFAAQLQLDVYAHDLYALSAQSPEAKKARRWYTEPLITR